MNEKEILEYNKRCAEFLGWKNLNDDSFPEYVNPLGDFYQLKELKFHSDWNWIMEVVDAIEKLGETDKTYGTLVDITTTYVKIGKVLIDLKLIPITKKEAVVDAINQFLIWYEQNK